MSLPLLTYLAIALRMLGVSAVAAWASARQLGRMPVARMLQADGQADSNYG